MFERTTPREQDLGTGSGGGESAPTPELERAPDQQPDPDPANAREATPGTTRLYVSKQRGITSIGHATGTYPVDADGGFEVATENVELVVTDCDASVSPQD